MDKSKKNDMLWVVMISVIIASFVFIYMYGFAPLDVTNDQWLKGTDDIAQHYLGWMAFRNSAWTFPFGLHDSLTNPYMISIVFTDSIPIYAIFFKVLSPILPDTFQYFGIYILMIFILQAFLSILLVRRLTSSKWIYTVVAIFFVMTPVMLNRCFGHTALSSHFLILIAYCLWAYSKELGYKRESILWFILGGLCVAIHIYFVPMIGLVLAARILDGCFKKEWKTILFMPILGAGVFASAYLLGVFSGKGGGSSWGLGYYITNLNALYNPLGNSNFMKTLPYFPGQEEGFAYLGLGTIVLFLVAVGIQSWKIKAKKINWKRIIVLTVLVVVTYALAMSIKISWNNHILFEYSLPDKIFDILSIFRSSGRFMWIIVYGIMIWSFYVIIRNVPKCSKIWICIISLCLLLQILDIGSCFRRRIAEVEPAIDIVEIDEFFKKGAEQNDHVVLINNINYYETNSYRDELFELAWLAEKNGMTINKFLCSRGEPLVGIWKTDTETILDELRTGTADKNTIYVFMKQYLWNEDFKDLNYYEVDGYIVGTYQEYDAPIYSLDDSFLEIDLDKDYWLSNGNDTENGRVLHEDGISYGPYITLSPGHYSILITGENVDACFYTVTPEVNIVELEHTDSSIKYEFSLNEEKENVEFYVNNTGTQDVLIESITLFKD